MSHNLALAQSFAFQLARTLMTPVVLFQGEGGYGVLPAAEYDGCADAILFEYDPFTA